MSDEENKDTKPEGEATGDQQVAGEQQPEKPAAAEAAEGSEAGEQVA